MKEFKTAPKEFRAWDGKEMREVLAVRWDSDPSMQLQVCCNYKSGRKIFFKPTKNKALVSYTGLKDKNGVKIFEGDVINGRWKGEDPGVVSFGDCSVDGGDYYSSCADAAYYVAFANDDSGNSFCEYEVIGNIYENPELITK